MSGFLQDVRYALRQMQKNSGFTVVAVVTLALGIGANTAMFSVINGVLLSPLPFAEPDRLITLHENKPHFEGGSLSYPNFRDWQKDNHTFSAIAISRSYAFGLTGVGDAEQVSGDYVSSDFFRVLGVSPIAGRTFLQGEDEVGAGPVALISAGLWQRKFGSAPDILGKSITLDANSYTIVGVIPANFHLMIPGFREGSVYVPIGQWNNSLLLQRGAGLGIHGIGRLRPGITIAQARADMANLSQNLAVAFPDTDKGISAGLVPLKTQMIGRVTTFLVVLLAAVGFVLLIACVNVANLLLARSTSRAREFAVRAALGASSSRVVRQLLTESVLLALAGGALGLLVAAWGTRAALGVLPAALPRAEEIAFDFHVLFFTAGVSLLSGILFGLTPAFKTVAPKIHETLKEGGRGLSGSRRHTQEIFVVTEMALAVVLLIGAGLTIRSLVRLWNVDPGFNAHNVLSFGHSMPPAMLRASPDAIRAAFRQYDEKLASVPGIESVSQVWGALPFGGDDEMLFWREDEAKPNNENDMSWAIDYIVEPGYLQTMEIPLRRGRFFTSQDNEHSPLVVVVDEVFAQQYFPGQDPIGKRIHVNRFEQPAEIVGIVGHAKQWGLAADEKHTLRSELYLPCMQMRDDFISMAPSGSTVIVRFQGASSGLMDAIRRVDAEISNQLVIYDPQTMDAIVADSLASPRFSMILLVAFASLAVVLASTGIYGVISYVVGQRVHEIGVRMALGAKPNDILRLILGRGGKIAATGVVLGLAGAFGVTRVMTKLLYGVSPKDPAVFAGVAVLLTLIAVAACYIPARRASKINPLRALRYE